jgi:hypothetical protein
MIVERDQFRLELAAPQNGQARVLWAKHIPPRRTIAMQRADHLSDDSAMRDDGNAFAFVRSCNFAERTQAALAQLAVTFTSGPAEAVVILPQVTVPKRCVEFFDDGDRRAVNFPTMNFL